jgi:hypothetical protein
VSSNAPVSAERSVLSVLLVMISAPHWAMGW